eukprot:jgi/Chlat1/4767/Chrsp308S04732
MHNATCVLREVLQEVCECHGLAEERLLQRPEAVTKLEFFMFNYPRMRALHCFPALTTLTITQQNLRRLFLYSNRIKRIENLNHLKSLEQLWLGNNQIEVLEGLETLTKLKDLNLVRNRIARIGDGLKYNMEITTLNLAHNCIGQFKDICNLAKLPKLVDLCFSDPHWGDNPLSLLCNYQTYVVFHLAQLHSLDTLVLTEDIKQLAQATYMKKRMYYNMRIKTLQRNTSYALRRAHEANQAKISQASVALNLLIRHLKDLDRELEDGCNNNGDELFVSQVRVKREALLEGTQRKKDEMELLVRRFEDSRARVHELCDGHVRRLLVELDTGGNIRLEDGKPSDLWYTSCVDLVKSRFFGGDYAGTGVVGLSRVTRVTRVHNRFLRGRFEECLEHLVDVADPTYKRNLEYLFYGDDGAGELMRVAEEGFYGLTPAVVLHNSVSCADQQRVQACLRGDADGCSSKRLQFGQLLVTKVFLGKSTQELRSGQINNTPARRSTPSARLPQDATPMLSVVERKDVMPEAYGTAVDSVFRPKSSDPKQRTWFVFQPFLVLPEYLVEFEYDLSHSHDNAGADAYNTLNTPALSPDTHTTDIIDPEMRPILRPLAAFLQQTGEHSNNLSPQPDESVIKTVNMPPILSSSRGTSKTSTGTITSELILACSRTPVFANVMYLNLHGSGIRCIEGLACLSNLRHLVLSFNEIQKVEGLSELRELEKLDLSFNVIRRIEGLRGQTALRQLELNNNLLTRIEDIQVLHKHVPQLTALSLHGNALCDAPGYRSFVARRLPRLTALDGQSEAAAAASASSQASNSNNNSSWRERAEDLSLEHLKLRRIQNLDGLPNLLRLSLADNEIGRIEGLESLNKLEELILTGNRILQVPGIREVLQLKELPKLIILDLAGNPLCKSEDYRLYVVYNLKNKLKVLDGVGIEAAEQSAAKSKYAGRLTTDFLEEHDFATLTALNLDNNMLTDVQELRHLTSLAVLRLNANRLENYPLFEPADDNHPLQVLQLGSNQITSLPSLHLSCFRHLRSLFLQDNGISRVEGLDSLSMLQELVLDRNCVRGMEAGSMRGLGNLRELRLEDNGMRTLAHIGVGAPRLRSLHLGGNRIADVVELDHLAACTELLELNFANNPIARKQVGQLFASDSVVRDVNPTPAAMIVAGKASDSIGTGKPRDYGAMRVAGMLGLGLEGINQTGSGKAPSSSVLQSTLSMSAAKGRVHSLLKGYYSRQNSL